MWTSIESMIGTAPGVSMRPFGISHIYDTNTTIKIYENNQTLRVSTRPFRICPISDMNIIKIYGNNKTSWNSWSMKVHKFLKPYNQTTSTFTLDKLGPYGIMPYGYDEFTPCIYLKLNRIYGVKNSPCNISELFSENQQKINNPYSEMPLSLRHGIKHINDSNNVWIECHGKTSNDTDAIGKLKYFPSNHEFNDEYFRLIHQRDYVSPLVAVKIIPYKNTEIKIQCSAWALNIIHSQKYKLGFVEFSLLLIDEYDEYDL